MVTVPVAGDRGLFGSISRWWRNWKQRRGSMHELNRCRDSEVAQLANDLGVTPSELRTLAGRWPDSADLLRRRMEAIRLDATQVGRTEPETSRDLQRVCGQCVSEARCEKDLDAGERERAWRGYCPNVVTLDALRSENRDRRLMRRSRNWQSF
jgi:uncharacterized protein YjiS (DUF1127 family)